MAEYIPSTADWVRKQVEAYEGSGGAQGTTLLDTGLPVIIVTNRGNQTGGMRKTPLMRVKDGSSYVLVGSKGGAPTNPAWVYNLRRTATWRFATRPRCTPCKFARLRMPANERGVGAGRRGVSALRGISDPYNAEYPGIRR